MPEDNLQEINPDDIPKPDGKVVSKQLHFFWIADCSESMNGKKIATLNQAIKETVPAIKEALKSYPQVEVMMRAIKFSNDAEWHVGPEPVPLSEFTWEDLECGGLTATAKAIDLLISALDIEEMPRRGLPPVCIMISDGYCTDPENEYNAAIESIDTIPWGVKSVRLAIAIGNESEYNEKELLRFVNQENVGLLKAHSPEELLSYIKWASVSASVASSTGRGGSSEGGSSNVNLTTPPVVVTSSTDLF